MKTKEQQNVDKMNPSIERIECPALPEHERWRVAHGEHTIATFPSLEEAQAFASIVTENGRLRLTEQATIANHEGAKEPTEDPYDKHVRIHGEDVPFEDTERDDHG